MRARHSAILLALTAITACGGGGSGSQLEPADTLDLAGSYTLTTVAGDTVPWHEPPPDERTYVTAGSVTVTPELFKAHLTGYLRVCPGCDSIPRLDSLYGPYTRVDPTSFVVMITVDRPMYLTLDAETRLHFREKVNFLGGIYELVFTPNR